MSGRAPSMTVGQIAALPVTIDLATAGQALGLGRTKAHELARADAFPVPVHRLGRRYRVMRSDLLGYLGIDTNPVTADSR